MGKRTPNRNSIDPTEYPLEKVPLVVSEDDSSSLNPADSPVEEGIEEEQQGDLEGLDGKNSLDEHPDLEIGGANPDEEDMSDVLPGN